MFKKKQTGPQKIGAAFGLFQNVIDKLQDGLTASLEESVEDFKQADYLTVRAHDAVAAAEKAQKAIDNIKTLIGDV
jgi:exonuclease VII small subunit